MKSPTPSPNTFLGYLSLLMLLGALFLISSCGSANLGGIPDNYQQLESLVDKQQFEIEHDWALPLRGGNINITGNSNFIRFEGDSISVFLPYFGVRHFGGSYGGDGGIEYEGLAENLEIEKEEERITMEFEGDDDGENLTFYLTLYPNGNANTTVQTTERDNISFRGTIREWNPEEEE